MRLIRPDCRSLELVHRLDKDTSGCLMLAKNRKTLRFLHEQLREKTSTKLYLALVEGKWPKTKRRVDAPLKKNELSSGERIVTADPDGKPSSTLFRIEQRYAQATLLQVQPLTGRTHQIRVHAKLAGHALAGDEKYGGRVFNQVMRGCGLRRLFLHAAELRVKVPGEKRTVIVKAPLDHKLMLILEKLGK